MGSRGPKPKAEGIARAQGNPGQRRIHSAGEPVLDGPELLTAPPRKLTVAGREIWQRLAPELARLNLVRETDRPALARYCEHLQRWWALTERLRAGGKNGGEVYTSKSQWGELKRLRPEFIVRDRIEARLEQLEDRFGLTPRARQELLRMAASLPAGGLFSAEAGAEQKQPGGETPAGSTVEPGAPPALGALAASATRH